MKVTYVHYDQKGVEDSKDWLYVDFDISMNDQGYSIQGIKEPGMISQAEHSILVDDDGKVVVLTQ